MRNRIKGITRKQLAIYMDVEKLDLIDMMADKFKITRSEMGNEMINSWLEKYFDENITNLPVPETRARQILDAIEKESQGLEDNIRMREEREKMELLKRKVVKQVEEPKQKPVAEKMWDV